MKSYGKVDASWDDAKFQAIIEDALQMVRNNMKPFTVALDEDGNVVVSERGVHRHVACACVADMHPKSQDTLVLRDNVGYNDTIEQMVPRVRDALTKGVFEYGDLGFLSEGLWQVGNAVACARRLVKIHGEPFIVGETDKGVTVAPLSERDRFLDVASCVVTKNGFWSMSDRLPVGDCHWLERRVPLRADALARYSVIVKNPAEHVFDGIMESSPVPSQT